MKQFKALELVAIPVRSSMAESWLDDGKDKLRSWEGVVLGVWGRWRGFFGGRLEQVGDVDKVEEEEELEEVVVVVEEEEEGLLFFLEPPPTGMFLKEPPSVQYLRHVLQKYLGCVRL